MKSTAIIYSSPKADRIVAGSSTVAATEREKQAMKSALSLALIVCLVGAGWRVRGGSEGRRSWAVVETIARDEVVEIRQLVRAGGSVARAALWAAGGYFAGGMAGGLIGGAVDAGLGGAFVGIIVGAPVGIIWGGIHGYRAGSHRAEDVVYRAP